MKYKVKWFFVDLWEDILRPFLVGLLCVLATLTVVGLFGTMVWGLADPDAYWATLGSWGWWFMVPCAAVAAVLVWLLGDYLLER